jgi:hypothetical protein
MDCSLLHAVHFQVDHAIATQIIADADEEMSYSPIFAHVQPFLLLLFHIGAPQH